MARVHSPAHGVGRALRPGDVGETRHLHLRPLTSGGSESGGLVLSSRARSFTALGALLGARAARRAKTDTSTLTLESLERADGASGRLEGEVFLNPDTLDFAIPSPCIGAVPAKALCGPGRAPRGRLCRLRLCASGTTGSTGGRTATAGWLGGRAFRSTGVEAAPQRCCAAGEGERGLGCGGCDCCSEWLI